MFAADTERDLLACMQFVRAVVRERLADAAVEGQADDAVLKGAGLFGRKQVRLADKARDEARLRPVVDLLRRAELF